MPKSKGYLKKDKGKIEGNLRKILDTDNMYNLGICGRLINNHLFVNLGAQLWGLQDLMKKKCMQKWCQTSYIFMAKPRLKSSLTDRKQWLIKKDFNTSVQNISQSIWLVVEVRFDAVKSLKDH